MNGLEEQYGEQVDFRMLNAEDGDTGQAAFTHYALRGHPSIIIITPEGKIAWQRVGVVEGEDIEQQIRSAVNGME